jgi:hypothetical protein
MRFRFYLSVSAVAASLPLAGCDAAREESRANTASRVTWFEAEELGVRFAYPDSFLVGRFAQEPLPPEAAARGLEAPFQNAVVLVHPSQLRSHPLDAIPVGDVPVIWLDRPNSAPALFRLLEPDSTYSIGPLTVSRFPGFPGPYGENAFYYVAEFPDGEFVELGAHRYLAGAEEPVETHYDRVIEAILESLARTGA